MIKKHRQNIGLSKFINTIAFIDSTENASHTFQVYDFPDRFYLGKNSFKILANTDNLENNAPILIDIEDKAGNPVYYEITALINKDRSRTIVVYIYDDMPIGNATVYIGSRVKRNPISGERINSDDIDSPNIIWKREVLVSTSQVSREPIIFSNPPVITFQERREQRYQFTTTSSRYTVVPSRGPSSTVSLTTQGRIYDLSNRGVKDVDLSSKTFDSLPDIQNLTGIYSGPDRIPSYGGFSVLETSGFPLSSSMEGGVFTVRSVDVSSSAPASIANSIGSPDYSASIIRVINSTTAELFPPFSYDFSYNDSGTLRSLSFNSFSGEINFTASWMNTVDTTLGATQSYLQLELSGLEPTTGIVSALQIRYKELGGYGEYYDLGKYEVKSQNLLVDSSSITFQSFGLSEKRIGYPESTDNPLTYWQTSSFGVSAISVARSDVKIQNSLFITSSGISNSGSYIELAVIPKYRVLSAENTEYELSFLTSPTATSSFAPPQIDIYISGSAISSDSVKSIPNRLPILNDVDGTYIGSIISSGETYKKHSYSFKTIESKRITPKFIIRSGIWNIGQIELATVSGKGFNSNHARLYVPLPVFPSEQELLFEIRYLNDKDEPSDLVQKLSGLYFRGSDPTLTIEKLTKNNVTFDYYDSGSAPWNRFALVNGGSFEMSYSSSLGESSLVYFLTQSYFTASGPIGVALHSTYYPALRDNISNQFYTGSNATTGLNYTIETMVFGKTGSFSQPKDTYLWSSTVQGRALVSKFDNSGQPLIFQNIAMSGSTAWMLGTFGTAPLGKTNLDSWYRVSSVSFLTGSLVLTHGFSVSSSFYWDFYFTSTCRINKFDVRY